MAQICCKRNQSSKVEISAEGNGMSQNIVLKPIHFVRGNHLNELSRNVEIH